jgi:hypothetical protein
MFFAEETGDATVFDASRNEGAPPTPAAATTPLKTHAASSFAVMDAVYTKPP